MGVRECVVEEGAPVAAAAADAACVALCLFTKDCSCGKILFS